MKNLKIVLVLLFSQFIFGTAKAQFNTLLGADPGCVAYNKASALCAVSSGDSMIISYHSHQNYRDIYGFMLQPPFTTPPSNIFDLPAKMAIYDMLRFVFLSHFSKIM